LQVLNHCSEIHFINYSEIRENSQYATKREDCGALLCSQQTASEPWKHGYLITKNKRNRLRHVSVCYLQNLFFVKGGLNVQSGTSTI
jgi:hypothetical protein